MITAAADTTAPDQPAESAASQVTAGDRYLDTLRRLDAACVSLHAALFGAPLIVGDAARSAALVDLHHRIRSMAVLANHALGGWPEPPDPQESR